MEQFSIDVVYNDFIQEMTKENLTYFPNTILKRESFISLRDFKFDMASTCFIRFLNRFCGERDLDWFVNFENRSIVIG